MNKKNQKDVQKHMPSAGEVAQELGKPTSIDDFMAKMGTLQNYFQKLLKRCWKQN